MGPYYSSARPVSSTPGPASAMLASSPSTDVSVCLSVSTGAGSGGRRMACAWRLQLDLHIGLIEINSIPLNPLLSCYPLSCLHILRLRLSYSCPRGGHELPRTLPLPTTCIQTSEPEYIRRFSLVKFSNTSFLPMNVFF